MKMTFAFSFFVVFAIAFFAVPATWLVMLAAGNFGFSQFGFVDCLPAGAIVAAVASSSNSSN